MSNYDTYELCNVDPEDISDVLLKVQKSFGFKFGPTELTSVKTFGELCDIIITNVQGDSVSDCTTQQAFYKIRDAIANTLLVDKNSIAPDTDLETLFPRNKRRQKVKEVKIKLNSQFDILQIKEWLKWIYLIGIAISLFMFIFRWQFALSGLTFFSLFGWTMNKFFATEIATQTVGQFAQKLATENYLKARRNPATINRDEIAKKVKELFKSELGLEDYALTSQATFM